MEIQILTPTQAQPLPPIQWNYAEVKAWIEDGLARYKGVVYDETQIAEAKKDRANLNKLVQALDAKRKEMKAMYLAPYEEFEAQAKELIAMVKEQAAAIDTQVKAYDDRRREEKLEKIKAELYAPMIDGLGDLVPYEKLHEPRWLNVTCSVSTIGTEMAQKIERIVAGLEAIDKLDLDDALTEQAKTTFLKDFDLAAAIKQTERILQQRAALERLKADAEAQKAAPAESCSAPKYTPPAPVSAQERAPGAGEKIHTVIFRIHVTAAQLKGLGDYMRANNIKPERV